MPLKQTIGNVTCDIVHLPHEVARRGFCPGEVNIVHVELKISKVQCCLRCEFHNSTGLTRYGNFGDQWSRKGFVIACSHGGAVQEESKGVYLCEKRISPTWVLEVQENSRCLLTPGHRSAIRRDFEVSHTKSIVFGGLDARGNRSTWFTTWACGGPGFYQDWALSENTVRE